jgi:FkbM family methyltransferase
MTSSKNKHKFDYEFINNMKNPKLVQVGACDGVMADNVRKYILNRKIQSLLIEPVSYNFEMLKKNYKDEYVRLENTAIDVESRTREITYFVDSPGNSHAIGLASFYSTGWEKKYTKQMRKEIVNCETLDTVLTRNAMLDANVFQIDTEGHDYHIVKQIPFEKHVNAEFFLASEHFWDPNTEDVNNEKEALVAKLINLGFHVEFIYGRRAGSRNGLQVKNDS